MVKDSQSIITKNSNSKFVVEDDVSEFFDFIITDQIGSKSESVFDSGFNSSHMTWCPRRMIYCSQGVNPDRNSKSYIDISTDLAVKNKWIGYFKKCRGVKIVNQIIRASDCNYNIHGDIDAILKTSDIEVVAKFQAVDNMDFQMVNKKGAFKNHVVELMTNMWLAETVNGLLVYENKNDQKYKMFHVKQYRPVIVSIQMKCLKLFKELIKGFVPDRPYKQKAKECGRCEYYIKCWE